MKVLYISSVFSNWRVVCTVEIVNVENVSTGFYVSTLIHKLNALRQIWGKVRVRCVQRKTESRDSSQLARFFKLNFRDLPVTGFSPGGSSECISLDVF
jgi:hypothetical protein